jgi:hypothetical protein
VCKTCATERANKILLGPTSSYEAMPGHGTTELALSRQGLSVYSARYFVAVGGLIAYVPDFLIQHRRAAGYVDRILKGETR